MYRRSTNHQGENKCTWDYCISQYCITATGVFILRLCVITITDYIEYVNSEWVQDFSAAQVSI